MRELNLREEIVSLRRENSKTYRLGGRKRVLEVSIGSIHYKDNYANKSEQWKDIDLIWEGNKITKAPYELTLNEQKITVKDKKTGDISTIELTSVKPSGLKFEIVPEFSAVKFQHTLPSDKIPFEAKFKVTGKGMVTTRAFDDEGELELETSLVDGVLTEKLSEVKDKATGQVRPAKGNIRIDPTLTVQPSGKDTTLQENEATTNYGSSTSVNVRSSLTVRRYSILEFAINWGTDIPAGAILSAATFSLYDYALLGSSAAGRTYWAYRLTRTDWVELQATWNIYKTGSNWTTAGGDYTTDDGASATVPAALNWMNWSVLAQVQYAQTNDIAVEFLVKDGADDVAKGTSFYSNNYTDDTSLCPKLVIEYTESYNWAVEALEEKEAVYLEALLNGGYETRRDVSGESEESITTIIADMKTAYPNSDTYYRHNHHHGDSMASCVQTSV